MKVYLDQILPRIPQIISQIDREPFSLTYGCGDRVFWCWKFTDFPGARFQEYIFTLSWLYTSESFDNPWKGNKNVLETVCSGFNYWASIQYKNGSYDEAYPFEYSLAATAFTMFYLTEGYFLVNHNIDKQTDIIFKSALGKAAEWLCKNDEKHGILSNHLAAAAAGIYNAGLILENDKYIRRSTYFVQRIYEHQSDEGWYEEYGGADPGYQTHCSFYLARLWQKSHDPQLLASLKRANAFIRFFFHPDGSLGGEYASRNTMFYYPAAFEILSEVCENAKSIAAFQRDIIDTAGTVGIPQMDVYNLFPVLNNYIFAHENNTFCSAEGQIHFLPFQEIGEWDFTHSGLLIRTTELYYAIIGCKKGGVIRIWDKKQRKLAFQSSGYVAKKNGKWISNQSQGLSEFSTNSSKITINAPFSFINMRIFSPLVFIGFRLFTISLGRMPSFAYAVKNLLVKILVKKNNELPQTLTRTIHFKEDLVTIEDRLSDRNLIVTHLDKFSTIHMGSSRYANIKEELIRGIGYINTTTSIDQNGVIHKIEIHFV